MAESERQHTVLVVEDDRHARELLVFTMEDAGYVVLPAGNGAEALNVLE